jgi:PAS domain S-box-containing protein
MARAKKLAGDILLSQKIGKTGYICILDGSGKVVKHPKKSLEGLDISDHRFVREMIAKKNGYIEYEWQNPDDPAPRAKALYLTWFRPWNWMITVSSYRKEFSRLLNINDFKKNILSLRFGKTGFCFVMDTSGNIIIHPDLAGINISGLPPDEAGFFRKIITMGTGKIIYSRKKSGNGRHEKKLVIFNYIPEYEWIVASTSFLDEVFAPLKTIRTFIIAVCCASFVIFIPISFFLSSTITKPLQELMNRFDQDIVNGFSNRMVKMASRDEVGQLSLYYNSFMDRLESYDKSLKAEIKERRQAQEALRESEEKYRSVMEATPDPIVVYDMQGRVTYMNPAFTRVFGYTLEECLGKKMDHFVPEEHWKETMEGIGTILRGELLPRTETRRTSKDGKTIDVTTRGSVYRNKKGEPIGSVITHRDISEVKRLEKAIMETGEKERQKIGNDLHDDLCPHLIGIEGLTKVLNQKINEFDPEASRLADQITELIREAIHKTRSLARGLCPVYFNLGLESSLRQLVANTKNIHRIQCRLECGNSVPQGNHMVNVNLYHIVQEAVQNAIRHGNAREITILMEACKDQFRLIIKDDGCGMTHSQESAGMGLRIMHYRAKLMGASLRISSGSGGHQGVKITIAMPLETLC